MLTLLFALVSLSPGQTAQEARTEFEVASVKLVNHPVRPHPVGLIIKHGTLTMEAAALRQIVGLAYGIQRVRVYGGPDWMDSELYDIQAKSGNPDATRDQIQAMLQTLLTDRFQLKFHHENRHLPVFTLAVAPGGPKLEEAKAEDPTGVNTDASSGHLTVTIKRQAIAGLVNYLANMLRNPVLDKTGLSGLYNFKLEFVPDLPARPGGDPPMLNGVPVDSGPSLVTAVREQLGLKLEERKEPVEVMVIDHAEHASEN